MSTIISRISVAICRHDCELKHSTSIQLWDWWVNSWLSCVVMEIRLLKFTPDWRMVGVWLTWLVIRTGISDLLSSTKSWSSLINRSVSERDEGGRWLPCLDCFCFLLTPHRDVFSANQRRLAVSEGDKSGLGSNEQVSYQEVEGDCIVWTHAWIAHLWQTSVPVESRLLARVRNR